MNKWKEMVSARMPVAIEMLQTYCRQPSISAQNVGIAETVHMVRAMIESAGGHVETLDGGGYPVLCATFEAGPKGNPNKTLLFYNHYDVQPPEPLDAWTVEPFGANIVDGKLYARGVADNKGDLIVRLNAVALHQAQGGLPCRVKWLIEGEEEIGSPTLETVLRQHADLFAADACIWEFGHKDAQERPEMVAGIKGMCYLQFWCDGADVDCHSSLGAIFDNAAWRLVQALGSMRTVENRITVEGFYDDVVTPSTALTEIAHRLSYNVESANKIYGLKRPLIVSDDQIMTSLLYEPTMTLCGIESGYTGPGSKTVLPRRAQAKVDCRMVPNQDPDDILRKVRRHLDAHGFDDVSVSLVNGQKAYRCDMDDPFIATVLETARQAYGVEPVLWPNSAGTGPMYAFGEHLHAPIVSTGCGWYNSRAHAPDESVRIADVEEGMLHMVYLLEAFGRADVEPNGRTEIPG